MKKVLNIILLINFCVVIAANGSSLFLCLQDDSQQLVGWNSCAKESQKDSCCNKADKPAIENDTFLKCCQKLNLNFELAANTPDHKSHKFEKAPDGDKNHFPISFNDRLPAVKHISFINSKSPPDRRFVDRQHTHKYLSIYIC